MTTSITAHQDSHLSARIVARTPLLYDNEVTDGTRPPHVRAASSLAPLREHLAVIQDDAHYLAVVEPKTHRATSLALPRGDEFGDEKLDLEACVSVPGTNNQLLVALGSGSKASREWIMLVDWRGQDELPRVELHHADAWFDYLREQTDFVGAGLNIEGAVFSDHNTLRLFQRGNFTADGLPSIDATADVQWPELLAYLQHETSQPPRLEQITHYSLGTVNNARLNFSDAEKVGDNILFSASAEAGTTGENAGSALGVIAGDSVRWCNVVDEDGQEFTGKIEGLSVDPSDNHRVWFVIDADDPDNPSEIFEAELDGEWF